MADALSAHETALQFGGREGIINLASVESAIGRPYVGYYPEIWKKCAALVQSMAGNHGFTDANKRTTLILLHTLISKSGYELSLLETDSERAVDGLILACTGVDDDGKPTPRPPMPELIDWFKARLKRLKRH